MEVIFKRSQYTSFRGRTNFKLHGRFSFSDEETKLINQYDLNHAQLHNLPQVGLIPRSIFLGLLVALAVFFFLIFNLETRWFDLYWRIPTNLTLVLSALLGTSVGYLFYNERRSMIYLRDLIHGRTFACSSVSELARKEGHLHAMAFQFRQLLEATKTWGGEEKHDVPVLSPQEAKEALIKGPYL